MRRNSSILAAAFALFLVLVAPAKAAADFFLTPFAGVTFLDGEHNKGTFGAGIGFGGLVSVEFEAASTPLGSYKGIPVVDLNARVGTYMGNLMFRLPRGPIQPYVSGGAGIVRLTGSADVPFLGSVFSASADDVGYNIGGGVMIFPGTNIGIRADIRRFQTGTLSWNDVTDIDGLDDLPLPKVNFWRATGGVTFKF
jgi:opacity protein-like surface antigen